jgi:hypothetical protein
VCPWNFASDHRLVVFRLGPFMVWVRKRPDSSMLRLDEGRQAGCVVAGNGEPGWWNGGPERVSRLWLLLCDAARRLELEEVLLSCEV